MQEPNADKNATSSNDCHSKKLDLTFIFNTLAI